jgi:hypothetical protein
VKVLTALRVNIAVSLATAGSRYEVPVSLLGEVIGNHVLNHAKWRGPFLRPDRSPRYRNLVDPQLRADLIIRWPSTTSPSLRANTGILKPISRMLEHMRPRRRRFFGDCGRREPGGRLAKSESSGAVAVRLNP